MRAKAEQASSAIDWTALHQRLDIVQQAIDGAVMPTSAQRERILRERAEQLARVATGRDAIGEHGETLNALVFRLAGERYALTAAHIAKVLPMAELTSLPGVPDFVVGITTFQGEVLSVIDLRILLDLPVARLVDPTAIVVLHGAGMEFGVLAEEILGIGSYASEELEASLPSLSDKERTYLTGIAIDRTAVLDAAQLLSDPKVIVDAK
jgi:purine-binding chemotaxis protein CheW